MNLAVRHVLARQTFRLCDRVPYKCLQKHNVITSTCPVIQFRRNYCEERMESRSLPQLMEFPPIMSKSPIKFVKNWMFAYFIIRPYFDQEFSLIAFTEASKHAVQVVSDALRRNDFKTLEGLVEKDAMESLKNAVSQLSIPQRQMLATNKDDIIEAFPYQVAVTFDGVDKRCVEITMVYHVLRGFSEIKETLETGDLPRLLSAVAGLGDMYRDYDDQLCILNYRFIREFTKGVDDSWLVNIVNHYTLRTLMKTTFDDFKKNL